MPKTTNFYKLPQIAAAAQATTPVPVTHNANETFDGALAWSTTLAEIVRWDGSRWIPLNTQQAASNVAAVPTVPPTMVLPHTASAVSQHAQAGCQQIQFKISQGTAGSSGTSYSFTTTALTTTPVVGNMLILEISQGAGYYGFSTSVTSSGWTLIHDSATTGSAVYTNLAAFWKIATSADTGAVGITLSGATADIVGYMTRVTEISGAANTAPSYAVGVLASGTSLNFTSISSANQGAWNLYTVLDSGSNATSYWYTGLSSPPTGITNDIYDDQGVGTSNSSYLAVGYYNQTAAAANTTPFTTTFVNGNSGSGPYFSTSGNKSLFISVAFSSSVVTNTNIVFSTAPATGNLVLLATAAKNLQSALTPTGQTVINNYGGTVSDLATFYEIAPASTTTYASESLMVPPSLDYIVAAGIEVSNSSTATFTTATTAIAGSSASFTLVQVGTGTALANGTPAAVNATMPSAPTNGNFLLGFLGADSVNNGSVSPYTQIIYEPGSYPDIAVSYKYAGSGESTTQSPDKSGTETCYESAVVIELSGVASSSPLNTSNVAVNVSGSSGAYTAPSITTTGTTAIFAWFTFEDYQSITGASPPSGWTLLGPYLANGGNTSNIPIRQYGLYKLNATAGTYAPVLTITGSPSVGGPTAVILALNQSNGVYTSPAITTTDTAAIFVIYSFLDNAGITTFTPASGYTLLGPYSSVGSTYTDPVRMAICYKLAQAPTSGLTTTLTIAGTPSGSTTADITAIAVYRAAPPAIVGASFTIPANTLSVGAVFLCKIYGTLTVANSQSTIVTTNIQLDGANMATAIATSTTTANSYGFESEFIVTVMSIGSSGTMFAVASGAFGIINALASDNIVSSNTGTTTTINTTVSNTLSIGLSANNGQTLTIRNAFIREMV